MLAGIAADTWPRIRQAVVETHDVDGRPAVVRDLLVARGFRYVIADAGAVSSLAGGPRSDVMVYARR